MDGLSSTQQQRRDAVLSVLSDSSADFAVYDPKLKDAIASHIEAASSQSTRFQLTGAAPDLLATLGAKASVKPTFLTSSGRPSSVPVISPLPRPGQRQVPTEQKAKAAFGITVSELRTLQLGEPKKPEHDDISGFMPAAGTGFSLASRYASSAAPAPEPVAPAAVEQAKPIGGLSLPSDLAAAISLSTVPARTPKAVPSASPTAAMQNSSSSSSSSSSSMPHPSSSRLDALAFSMNFLGSGLATGTARSGYGASAPLGTARSTALAVQ